MRTLTLEEARQRILEEQGLCSPLESPLEAVDACFAVQTQYAASLPVAIAARVKHPRLGWDDRALAVGGSLVKSWSLRRTLHAHGRAHHSLVIAAIGQHHRAHIAERLMELHAVDVDSTECSILAALQEGPLTRKQLHERVPDLRKIDFAGWGLDVMSLAFKGQISIIGKGAEQRFAAVAAPASHVSPMADLLRKYLRAYGPATKRDFAYWVGLTGMATKGAFDEIEGDIEPVRIAGLDGERFVLRGEAVPGEIPKARLLAKFDPLVMAHADKRLFLREEHRKSVSRPAGQVEASVLVNGEIAATWRMAINAKTLKVTLEPLRQLRKTELAAIDREAARLAKAVGRKAWIVEHV